MDIRQLRYFAAVVEEGTISAAARKLNISQPPLSMQIRQLEKELGVVLFERGARKITLTEAGSILYKYALEILEMESIAEDEIANYRLGRKGSIRIGMISSSFSQEVFALLREFHRQYPQVRFKVQEGNTFQLLEMLEQARIELAVLRTPYPDRGFESALIRRDVMCAAGRPEFFPDAVREKKNSRKETGIRLQNLAGVPLILYRRWENPIREAFNRLKISPVIVCVNEDARTSIQWSQAGMGVTLAPASVADWDSGLEIYPIKNDALVSDLNIIRRKDTPVSQSAGALFEMAQMRELLKKQPGE